MGTLRLYVFHSQEVRVSAASAPLAIDLFCGLGGWAEGFLAEGYRVIGYDIKRHEYGNGSYPAQLVLQDVLALHGSQFAEAAVIVASPPCTEFSYRGMPWGRIRKLPPPDTSLFDACFRIQRQACEAACRHIPLIVENVKTAQEFVGPARWHFGSFYLWGDVPALMPKAEKAKVSGENWSRFTKTGEVSPHWRLAGIKAVSPGHLQPPGSGQDWFDGGAAAFGSGSTARAKASAELAKIPFPLAKHIAAVFRANA